MTTSSSNSYSYTQLSFSPARTWLGRVAAALAFLSLSFGCSAAPKLNFDELYSRAAQVRDDQRNPIIVIPGALGSRLESPEGVVVWGAFDKTTARPDTEVGSRLVALPMGSELSFPELRDNVRATGVLDRIRIRLFGIPVQLQAYSNIMMALGVDGGYRDSSIEFGNVDYGTEHFTCFQFPYDWRRDISESAAQLDQFIREKKASVESEILQRYGVEKEVKFDLVTHSMGGLVARYYLRYGGQVLLDDGSLPELTWAGAEFVEKAILVGPPSHGSPDALFKLVEGFKPGPFLRAYPSAVIGTMPSTYQLLPRERHGAVVDGDRPSESLEGLFDPEFWEEMEWGLLDPAQAEVLGWLLPDVTDPLARRAVAKKHLARSLERARQFGEAMDQPAKPPAGLDLYLVAGDATPTTETVAVDLETGKIEVRSKGPGDGTVLRTSALGDERVGGQWTRRMNSPVDWRNVTFIFSDHVGLTKDPMFVDNLLYLLLEQ